MLWIAEQLANANAEHEPELGGPTTAKLADALRLYAGLYTINKGGFASKLNRINHYQEGAGFAPLKRVPNDTQGHKLVEYERRPSNGSNGAQVIAHCHDNGALLSSQMFVNFRHGGTLQQKVLHLVFENAPR